MGRLKGKVAIVTGGASGIGEATARLFSEEEASVVVADVDEQGGQRVVEQLCDQGGIASFVRTDVTIPQDVDVLVRTAVETFGGLHVLFNNAGIESEQVPTAEATLENWDRVIATNLTGVFLGMKYSIPAMLESGGGSIVNTASMVGLIGFPNIGAYCAAKGGVVLLTKTAALEYAKKGIRINAVCPGTTLTPHVKRFIAATEVSLE
jgi:NAD(P)-dependent dehydrogenase (short-subunit alcohol dehydrogenase family)